MKILIEPTTKKINYQDADGLILALRDYSVQSMCYFDLKEIIDIKNNNPELEIFVSLNKNFMNEELVDLRNMLIELDKLDINGILFYDSAVIQLKRELKLSIDLVWSANYMVNNYRTCNYYYSNGVNYAYVSKEITLEEIKDIIINSEMKIMVEVIGLPSVSFSKRKLITNFYADLDKSHKGNIEITEKVTGDNYILIEDRNGTSFFLDKLVNGTTVIKELYKINCPYIVMKEYGIECELFYELVRDTRQYLLSNCEDNSYVSKYQKLGDFTNFFYRKTIFRVKKNG